MFDGSPYFPAMSTRVHEQLAYAKCPDDVKDAMVPIVTLTRYKKSETLAETASVLLSDLGGRSAIVDFDPEPRPTTSAEEAAERRKRNAEARMAKGEPPARPRSIKQLGNDAENRHRTEVFNQHVSDLIDPRGGASRWIEMISEFPTLIPVIQIAPGQIEPQIDIVRRKGMRGAFRIKARDPNQTRMFLESIAAVRDNANSIAVVVDFEDVRGRISPTLEAAKTFYSQLYEGLGDAADTLQTILLSNSFPKPPLKDVARNLEIEDTRFHRELSTTFATHYGDYMSIPPRRGSGITANGWFPHVDLVSPDHWHISLYENNSDETKYIDAAVDIVKGEYWRKRENCWGATIIERVSSERSLAIDGKRFTTPTSWLTVRANQHVTQMALNR
ncbi:beta family protein [Agrobacterium burrii]|uniref:Beta protein n=1 Tax=Agrobacterium burrii TaxID=2815339 RepID=A0ABS3EJZ9_9HYPH|nr:hypothetical protein [Agrobacterium burrii]MBO0132279.1 hypothetical protein [Agrobacterium burrii]